MPAQAPPGGGSGGPFTRPLWTEIAITVLLIAAAIYAVGRNSRRRQPEQQIHRYRVLHDAWLVNVVHRWRDAGAGSPVHRE